MQLHINNRESYLDFSLELKKLNTSSYRKVLQKLYKMIKKIDSNILIIWYQLEEKENEVMESNEAGVTVNAKDVLLNFSEAIPNYL